MNKNPNNYIKKSNRIKRTIISIGITIFLLGIVISIVQYTLNKKTQKKYSLNLQKEDSLNLQKEESLNLQKEEGSVSYSINLEGDTIIYKDNLDLNLNIENFDENKKYEISINVDKEVFCEKKEIGRVNNINIQLKDDGEKELEIIIYKEDKEETRNQWKIYYIKPYQKQFLDELSNFGFATHYISNFDDINKSFELLKNSGAKSIRNSIGWNEIELNGEYSFDKIDNWMEKISQENISVLAILLDTTSKRLGKDYQISSEEELIKSTKYAEEVLKKYSENIMGVEVWNEPNINWTTYEAKKWYSKFVNNIKEMNYKNKIAIGATATPYKTDGSEQYFMDLANLGCYKNSNIFSYHIYCYSDDMQWLKMANSGHRNMVSDLGGFQYLYITEFGISNTKVMDEDIRSSKLIKESIININQGVDKEYMYDFIDDNTTSKQHGVLTKNNVPKKAYFAVQNYCTNTNGAEYIGTLNIQDGLETHIYDKDGKPLIITWSDNTENTYDFTLNNMTAKDIYGKEITPDENGKIQIATSPVYLYNAPKSYFYQAISNTATKKYNEFTEKFSEQISKVPGLQSSIQTSIKAVQDLSGNPAPSETTTINLMNKHYNLGSTILQAYKSGKLQIEHVQLSSMLDMLDDIGNSFEDLVTVSAKTRNSNLTETQNVITTAENLIKNNEDLNIIYPNKILEFSIDYYEKAKYINSLEEENDIKTGLIVSKNLHSVLLANWANEFTKIYIEDYIKNNPVEIEYSITDITNQNVTATIKTNANITVTNNQNSKTYTFTQNGSFTFEYLVKGQAFKLTATVNNIDKIAPTISGVQSEGFYTANVTPKITDVNLKEVKLYKNSNLVSNYIQDSTISEDGSYKIIATDKAGNQTEISFDTVQANNDNTVASKILPKTGAQKVALIVALIVVLIGVIGVACLIRSNNRTLLIKSMKQTV